MQTTRLYHCREKIVLRFNPKASNFLKGLTSNVLEAPQNAFLDIQGKIVSCFDQIALNADEVLAVLERPFLERLRGHLKTYLSLSETGFTEEPWQVYFDLEGSYEPPTPSFMIPQRKGCLLLSEIELKADVKEENFTIFRLQNGIPLQGVDFDRELLLNIDEDSRVSYTKGCYLGQEIIARVHYRARPPKKMEVRFEDSLSPEDAARLTSRSKEPRSGRVFGFLLYALGPPGLE